VASPSVCQMRFTRSGPVCALARPTSSLLLVHSPQESDTTQARLDKESDGAETLFEGYCSRALALSLSRGLRL
jgi:hypothetical protein